jgi:hypothetical protein
MMKNFNLKFFENTGNQKENKTSPTNTLTNQNKMKTIDLRINTLSNIENSSPNTKMELIPSTTVSIKKGGEKFKFNNGSMSTKNSEKTMTMTMMEKKLFKVSSLNDFNGNNVKNSLVIKKTIPSIKANLDRVKISHKNFGIIEAYAAITTEGLYRYL